MTFKYQGWTSCPKQWESKNMQETETNVWGTPYDRIDEEEFCLECEHSIPGHYDNCPKHQKYIHTGFELGAL